MAIRPIRLVPDPVLRQVAAPVASVTADIRTLLNDMLDTMYHADGVGLAAPQVGVSQRVIVCDAPTAADEKMPDAARAPRPLKMVNPDIVWMSEDDMYTREEGCLSLPSSGVIRGDVTRPARVRVRYLDEKGNACELEADGLLATCLQHEVDHLNGVLFIDHLSRLKRDVLMKKYRKKMRAAGDSPHDHKDL